jgi:hypothetical protein
LAGAIVRMSFGMANVRSPSAIATSNALGGQTSEERHHRGRAAIWRVASIVSGTTLGRRPGRRRPWVALVHTLVTAQGQGQRGPSAFIRSKTASCIRMRLTMKASGWSAGTRRCPMKATSGRPA